MLSASTLNPYLVHKVQSTDIIGLLKGLCFHKAAEVVAIHSDNQATVWQQRIRQLELLHVLKLGLRHVLCTNMQ